MKFHGRLAPGHIDDLGDVVELRLHMPKNAAGVTIKVWEMDTFTDGEGDEGGADDLLATFTGDIVDRELVVADAKIEEAPPEVVRVTLRVGGTDYDVPILSEKDEAEGDHFELGFSIELGGAEKFKSQAPCLVTPPHDTIRVIEARFTAYGDDYAPHPDTIEERPMALRFAAFGTCEGDPDDDKSKLKVLGNGHVDQHGYLVVHPDESEEGAAIVAKQVRRGRPLFVYVHDDPAPIALGVSKIRIPLCDPVGDRGVVKVHVPVAHNYWGAQFLEEPRVLVERDGRTRFGAGEPTEVEHPDVPSEPVAGLVDILARLLPSLRGGRP